MNRGFDSMASKSDNSASMDDPNDGKAFSVITNYVMLLSICNCLCAH